MCGIAGVYNTKGVNLKKLRAMSTSIRHRGPDDEGFALYGNDEVVFVGGDDSIEELSELSHISQMKNFEHKLGFAHRRLSILDLSKNGHQPMTYSDGRYTITYNGEVYNFKEIRTELEGKNYSFTSNSDTEVILAAYVEWGQKCVDHFIGMWAFAILDKKENQIFLSRDRFGIKPLYFYYLDGVLIFASEIKAILAYDLVKPEIDKQNLFNYIYWGKNTNQESTLFKNIKELPAANNAIFDIATKSFNKYQYYNLEDSLSSKKINGKSEESVIKEYQKLLQNSTLLHMRSDVSVGSCLSGGLDSSALTYFAASSLDERSFNTFTASFKNTAIDETHFAKLVSGPMPNISAHYTYPNENVFWKDFDKLIFHQDLPIASSSIFAQWEVMKLAKKNNTKVLLDGQGADEALGGYSYFTGIYLIELLKKLRFREFFNQSRKIKENRSVSIFNELSRAYFSFLPHSTKAFFRENFRKGSQYLSKEFISEHKNSKNLYVQTENSYIKKNISAIKYGMHELLRYEDRNSMAYSIESRVPFLDHNLVELSLKIPFKYKIKSGWTKYILRKSIENKVNDKVVWRKDKKGFVTPQGEWKNNLRKELIEYIEKSNVPEFIDKDFLISQTNKDIKNATELSEYWKMISIVKWIEIFNIKF